ncbi:MAG: radical SAM-associated putative lipoprotein [Tidjanibacter sp.]|nr:hypothetical protein [Rikenellaceae bacterium]MBQ8335877.1 radical SAM-associated putative lipoprotein [Tidjanibacter sp.]
MKRGLKNALLGLLGFSAAPMLTACYGVEPDIPDQYWDRTFKGQVTDTLGNPLKGIQVYVSQGDYWCAPDGVPEMDSSIEPTLTDERGNFEIYIHTSDGNARFVAADIDGLDNGHYKHAEESVIDFDGTLEMLPVEVVE